MFVPSVNRCWIFEKKLQDYINLDQLWNTLQLQVIPVQFFKYHSITIQKRYSINTDKNPICSCRDGSSSPVTSLWNNSISFQLMQKALSFMFDRALETSLLLLLPGACVTIFAKKVVCLIFVENFYLFQVKRQ